MTVLGVIPARYASSRFPGKSLAQIAGRPMVEWVWRSAQASNRLRDIIVATDDERIAEVCRGFGASVAMTRSTHPTGSDRIAEVARSVEDDILVNIQGDEPLIEGISIDAVVDALLESRETPMSTLVHPLDADSADDPNRVKVVIDDRGDAASFSRKPISEIPEHGLQPQPWQHVGIYAYRREFLLEFAGLPQSEAECSEGLEQLRALDNGYRIRCAILESYRSAAVDIPSDIAEVERRLKILESASSLDA